MARSHSLILFILMLTGCTRAAENTTSDGDALTAGDLDRFLAVVQAHSGAMIPEFTPLDDDDSPDLNMPAGELVTSFQDQFRRLFDVERQGAIWARDKQWSSALARQKIPPARFAALVRDVSLGVMRVRLEARVDLAQLGAQSRRRVERIVRNMNEIDVLPSGERTREAKVLRNVLATRLGQTIALVEFAELLRKVPPESAAVVRRYSRQLKPLLPASINNELLAELKALAIAPADEIEQVGHETPQDE